MEERDFRQGAFKIEDGKAKEIEDLLRYFTIEGKPIRALRFDPNILAANRDKLKNRTLFMKNLPKDLIESVDCKLIFLPPYSPDLNPIEKFGANIAKAS